jgi:hypothetical protein
MTTQTALHYALDGPVNFYTPATVEVKVRRAGTTDLRNDTPVNSTEMRLKSRATSTTAHIDSPQISHSYAGSIHTPPCNWQEISLQSAVIVCYLPLIGTMDFGGHVPYVLVLSEHLYFILGWAHRARMAYLQKGPHL